MDVPAKQDFRFRIHKTVIILLGLARTSDATLANTDKVIVKVYRGYSVGMQVVTLDV
jgi:hypothetical protein